MDEADFIVLSANTSSYIYYAEDPVAPDAKIEDN